MTVVLEPPTNADSQTLLAFNSVREQLEEAFGVGSWRLAPVSIMYQAGAPSIEIYVPRSRYDEAVMLAAEISSRVKRECGVRFSLLTLASDDEKSGSLDLVVDTNFAA